MRYGVGEDDGFRQEVRAFIAANAPAVQPKAGVRSADDLDELEQLKSWTRALFDAGYVGGAWPEEFGGAGSAHRFEHDVIVAEEIARSRAPAAVQGAGTLVAAAMIEFGTTQQKKDHLSRIRSGDDIYCQLFSEPGSGSDLASLRSRAVPVDGGGYRVTGQKVWTTNGHWADFGFLLARTDPDVPKHKGITAFLVDMRSPGVSVRPLREITGTTDFNEVFLDDVLVGTDTVVGEPGQGWTVANAILRHERAGVATNAVRLQRNVEAVVDLAKTVRRHGRPAIEDAAVVDRLGELAASADALSALVYAALTRVSQGDAQLGDAPMTKLMFSELGVEIARFALELCGSRGAIESGEGVVDGGRWQDEFLYARAFTIAGGSSEIMRNLIAERHLGLPR